MGIILAIGNQKGGIGKTTTAVNLAMSLTFLKKKVLLIDLDQQANATDTFKGKIDNTATIYDILIDNSPVQDTIQKTPSGDIIAGDPQLADIERKLAEIGREHQVKKHLSTIVKDYDYIIIDTPPNLGVMLTNALTFANYVLIPVEADRYATQGLQQFFNTVESIKEYSNPNLKVLGIFFVKYDDRTIIAKEFRDMLPEIAQKTWHTKVFDTKIHSSIAVKYSQLEQTSLIDYDASNTVSLDYAKLTKEILEELKKNGEK